MIMKMTDDGNGGSGESPVPSCEPNLSGVRRSDEAHPSHCDLSSSDVERTSPPGLLMPTILWLRNSARSTERIDASLHHD